MLIKKRYCSHYVFRLKVWNLFYFSLKTCLILRLHLFELSMFCGYFFGTTRKSMSVFTSNVIFMGLLFCYSSSKISRCPNLLVWFLNSWTHALACFDFNLVCNDTLLCFVYRSIKLSSGHFAFCVLFCFFASLLWFFLLLTLEL